MSAQLPSPYLCTEEAGRFIGISARTLEKHRSSGTGPKYCKLGRRIVYAVSDLREWAGLRIKESTSTTILQQGEPTAEVETTGPEQLDSRGAARFLRLSLRTIEKYRIYRTGPKYNKTGRQITYAVSDLKEWAQRGAKRSISESGPTAVLPAIPATKRGIEMDGGAQ